MRFKSKLDINKLRSNNFLLVFNFGKKNKTKTMKLNQNNFFFGFSFMKSNKANNINEIKENMIREHLG